MLPGTRIPVADLTAGRLLREAGSEKGIEQTADIIVILDAGNFDVFESSWSRSKASKTPSAGE